MIRDAIPRHLRLQALITLIAMLTSGCLGHFYAVPRTELERLAQTPPEQRGQAIYAVQEFSTADEPEPAPPWAPVSGQPPPGYSFDVRGYWVPDFYVQYGAPYYEPPPYQSPEVHDASPVGVSGSSAGPSGSSSGSSGSIGNIGKVDELLVVVVVVGVVVGLALAATEGARYEGHVAVHPHHPLHLLHSNGSQSIVALDELSLAHLTTVDSATLSGAEGAGMWLRGSAPINRRGFSYQFGSGYDSFALPGLQNYRSLGFHFGLGYYPARTFGILAHSRLQFADEPLGSFYNVRLGMEAQWYPISLWRLHLGPFVGGGQSWSASAGAAMPTTSGKRPYLSAGALAEFEISTRLGLTFRFTEDYLPTAGPDTHRFINSWSVGLAVY